MRLFHRTPSSPQILREGFRDGSGTYGLGSVQTGVWFSDQPIKAHLQPGALLAIDVPDEVAAPYEVHRCERFRRQWNWREFFMPAEVVNKYGPAQVIGDTASP
jgi:hypothetical protein